MQIHNWHDAPQGEKHLGEFSILFPKAMKTSQGDRDWWLHKAKIYRTKKGGLYVSLRGFQTGEIDQYGKHKYQDISHPGSDWAADFQKEVIHAVEPFLPTAQSFT